MLATIYWNNGKNRSKIKNIPINEARELALSISPFSTATVIFGNKLESYSNHKLVNYKD